MADLSLPTDAPVPRHAAVGRRTPMAGAGDATARRPQLPMLAPERAERIRHVLGRAAVSRFTAGGKRCIWRWQALPAHGHDAGHELHLALGQHECLLTIHAEAAPLADPAIDLAAFDGAARAVAAALRYAALIEHLERLLGGQLVVRSAQPVVAPTPAHRRESGQAFGFRAGPEADAQTACIGVLQLGADDGTRWSSIAGSPMPAAALAGVPIAVSLLLDAELALPAAQLRRLHDGAVLLVARSRLDAAPCWLHPRGAALAWRAQRDGRHARVLGPTRTQAARAAPLTRSRSVMEEKQVPGSDGATPPAAVATDLTQQLETLTVRLDFVLGQVEVPHGQLAAMLAAGSVVDLGARLDTEAVVIRANGLAIARGELLEIGDVLGVRITRLQGDGPV